MRHVCLIAAVAILLQGSAPPPRQRITMWFWGASPDYRQALDAALVRPFNQSQDRYQLVVDFRASVDNDVRIAVMGGAGPDLLYTSGPSDVTPLARAGKLASLDPHAEKYHCTRRLLAPVLDSCRQFGHLKCLPSSLEADGMFYDKALFRSRGWQVTVVGAVAERLMRQAISEGLYASVTGNKGWQPVDENYADIFLNQYVTPLGLACLLDGQGDWRSASMRTASFTRLDAV